MSVSTSSVLSVCRPRGDRDTVLDPGRNELEHRAGYDKKQSK